MMRIPKDLSDQHAAALGHYWQTRQRQASQQQAAGRSDTGSRGAVTGGAQMDAFIDLFAGLIVIAGISRDCIFHRTSLELPGFFRPTKEWDILVIKDNSLVLAIEVKSHAGPSFGNNFNNRTEEAMGSALDLWTAYREGIFKSSPRPWLGYMMMIEDCPGSRKPVTVREPHFKVFPEFVDASYTVRYEQFCRKLVRERHYDTALFLTSDREGGQRGAYHEPAADLSFNTFARSLIAHVAAHAS